MAGHVTDDAVGFVIRGAPMMKRMRGHMDARAVSSLVFNRSVYSWFIIEAPSNDEADGIVVDMPMGLLEWKVTRCKASRLARRWSGRSSGVEDAADHQSRQALENSREALHFQIINNSCSSVSATSVQ